MGAIKVALVFDSDDLSTSGFGTYTISGRADSVDPVVEDAKRSMISTTYWEMIPPRV